MINPAINKHIPLSDPRLAKIWERAHLSLGTGKPAADTVIQEFLKLEKKRADDAEVALFGAFLGRLLFRFLPPEDGGLSRFKKACKLDPKNEAYRNVLEVIEEEEAEKKEARKAAGSKTKKK